MANTGARFPARFDPDTWETDLARSTPAGRTAAETAKAAYERSGVPSQRLRPCDPALPALAPPARGMKKRWAPRSQISRTATPVRPDARGC